jgi:phage-related protein
MGSSVPALPWWPATGGGKASAMTKLVFNGSYRVSGNGGLIEFIPPQEPSPGAQNKPDIKILQAEFGDGYSQPTPDGLNHVRSVLSLQWDYLEGCERDGIISFLECRGGTEPFIFRMPRERQWGERRAAFELCLYVRRMV